MTAYPALVSVLRALPPLADAAVQNGLVGTAEQVTFRPGGIVAVVEDHGALQQRMAEIDPATLYNPQAARNLTERLLANARRGWKPAPGVRVFYREPEIRVRVSRASQAIAGRTR